MNIKIFWYIVYKKCFLFDRNTKIYRKTYQKPGFKVQTKFRDKKRDCLSF